MDQIEVTIKIEAKNLINYILIGRSDKIEKLKEQCEKISDVPPEQQILIYKGKILSNDKFISDYNIDDGDNIILNKREDPTPINNPLDQNNDISILKDIFSNNNIINFSNNKEINFNEFSNSCKQIPDLLSFLKKIDFNKYNNFLQSLEARKFFDVLGISSEKFNQILNKPEMKDMMNIILNDPSLLEMGFNNPQIKKIIQNNPFLKFGFQYPQIFLSPQKIQMAQNLFKKDENNMIENSNTGISVSPNPFENSQILNSSGKK